MRFSNILKYEIRNFIQSKFALAGLMLGTMINLFAFYFTSKAFIPKVNLGFTANTSYFEYIVIGEIILILSTLIFSEPQELFERLKNIGLLEKYHLTKDGLYLNILKHYVGIVFLKLLLILFNLIILKIIFSVELTGQQFLIFFALNIVFSLFLVPFFLLVFTFTIIKGKKSSIGNYIFNIFSVLSGAYFPIEIFSNSNIKMILSKNPIYLQVTIFRNSLSGLDINIEAFISFLIWGLIAFLFFSLFKKMVQKFYLRNVL